MNPQTATGDEHAHVPEIDNIDSRDDSQSLQTSALNPEGLVSSSPGSLEAQSTIASGNNPPNVDVEHISFRKRWLRQKRLRPFYTLFGQLTVRYVLVGIYLLLLSALLFFYLDGPAFGLTLGLQCWSWKGRIAGGECQEFRGGHRNGLWWDRKGKGGDDDDEVELREVPSFATEYAPYVYLYSQEQHFPSNLEEHLENITPNYKYTPIQFPPPNISLNDLGDLSDDFGYDVYLSSNDDPDTMPKWLTGKNWNEPNSDKNSKNYGKTRAKSTIIVADKGERFLDERWGIVDDDEGIMFRNVTDVFYFYFYSFNLGNRVWKWRFGNHVGDWEHTMIRFVDGKPVAMFFSEHAGGVALSYDAVEKIGKRPITYSATGTHANYPKAGIHRRILPWSLLVDFADAGHLWDPVKNTNIFSLNLTTDMLLPYNNPEYTIQPTLSNPDAPTRWFDYDGRWGDRTYPISDKRQYGFWGVWYFVSGPLGPKWKELDRRGVCMGYFPCYVAKDLQGWRLSASMAAGVEPEQIVNGQMEEWKKKYENEYATKKGKEKHTEKEKGGKRVRKKPIGHLLRQQHQQKVIA